MLCQGSCILAKLEVSLEIIVSISVYASSLNFSLILQSKRKCFFPLYAYFEYLPVPILSLCALILKFVNSFLFCKSLPWMSKYGSYSILFLNVILVRN